MNIIIYIFLFIAAVIILKEIQLAIPKKKRELFNPFNWKKIRQKREFAYEQYAGGVADIIYNSSPERLWKYTATTREHIMEIVRNKSGNWVLVTKTSDQFKREGKNITDAAMFLGYVVGRYVNAQASVM